METEKSRPVEPTHEEEMLDEALDESFPASDPPSTNGSTSPPRDALADPD